MGKRVIVFVLGFPDQSVDIEMSKSRCDCSICDVRLILNIVGAEHIVRIVVEERNDIGFCRPRSEFDINVV